jgi:adenylosuccinate synthase
LQRIGAQLDAETDGRWVADRLSRRIFDAPERLMVIDSARIAGQIEGLRRAFGRGEVRHVHVSASRETRTARYEERRSRAEVQEAATYEEVTSDPTESQVDSLSDMADIAIDTDRDGHEDVVIRVAAQLGLLDREHAPCVDVIVGGLYAPRVRATSPFTSLRNTTS